MSGKTFAGIAVAACAALCVIQITVNNIRDDNRLATEATQRQQELDRQQHPPTTMEDIKAKVARDAENQYRVLVESGKSTKVERCVYAGQVVAAYLQAEDMDGYKAWEALKESECRAAGLPSN